MNKTCTSPEQSKKLIELGIDVKTADMFWADGERLAVWNNKDEELDTSDVPAWSLSALMNLLDDKAGLAKEYGLWFCYDNGKSHCTKHCETQIDAAFEMVCWLLENKKNDQSL